jgi:hypothetical protein
VLVLPLTIPLSPNHRPKPPSEHLNLDRESFWKKTIGYIAKQRVSHLSPRIVQAKRDLLAVATAMVALLKPAHKTGHCSTHKLLLYNSETACQNENWPPIFILILANFLGCLLILGICLFNILLFLMADFFSWRLIT